MKQIYKLATENEFGILPHRKEETNKQITNQEHFLECFQTEESLSARTCSAILIRVDIGGIIK